MEVCMQCHLETTSRALPNSLVRFGRGAFSYRPGEPLGDFVLHFDDTGRADKFEIVSSVYRLRQSRCFLESKGKLSCTTCHNPHDVPRGRILRDEALYDIANQMPVTTEAIGQLRTLSDGFGRSNRAREIVDTVNRGLLRDMKSLPKLERNDPLSAQATATLELLKVLLRSAAAEHRVAPRLIADSEDLELLATESEPDIPALKGWRRKLFGDDALRLKRGELALTLAGGEVRAVPAGKILA